MMTCPICKETFYCGFISKVDGKPICAPCKDIERQTNALPIINITPDLDSVDKYGGSP